MRGTLWLIAVVGALALVPATAGGSPQRDAPSAKTFKTTVKLNKVVPPAKRGTAYFKGVVRSKRGSCEKFRGVELQRDGGSVGPADTTDEKGKFEIEVLSFPPGTYKVYAPVLSGGDGITCKADHSTSFVR